jgi:uridine phosphorylase
LKSQPRGALITFVRSDFDEKDLLKLVKDARYVSESNEYSLFSGTCGRKNVSFLSTGSGPASLLTALYELTPSKIESLVRIGASGGLNGARIQEIVSVRTAFCMDSVSSTLVGGKRVSADTILSNRIREALDDRVKSRLENAVSVDAMYLFEKNIDRAEAQGAYCWDLETATTLAFGRKFNVKTASVLYIVSDRLGNTIRSYPPIRKLEFVSSVLEALSA